MQQTCKMCGQPEKIDFHVPDEIWAAVVPAEFRQLAVCLYCFDDEAAAKGVRYAATLEGVCFAGRAATVSFAIEHAV